MSHWGRRFALFGSDTYYPVGGWDDLHGLYPLQMDAEEDAREHWRDHDHWQLVDLKMGEVVWEKAAYDLNPCRDRDHEWGEWILDERASHLRDAPIKTRECANCGIKVSDGSYLYKIFPNLAPMSNSVPRMVVQQIISGG